MAIFSNNVSIANDGELIGGGIEWQSVKTANYTASAGEGIFANTTSGAFTVTLPSSPSQGDEVTIVDYAGTFGTNNLTVARNGSNIDGTAVDGTLATDRLNVRFVYIDATQGWRAIFDDASESYGPSYVAATGGTVTTSGDFKIHTFTGDGVFVVSCGGNPSGSDSVSYVVVAGGGAGGSDCGAGGGGAGGFREGIVSAPHYTASPLATTGLPVSATTYPITVGSGGSGLNAFQSGPNGSNSVFSTITSAGGGGGNGNCAYAPCATAKAGGSGGGSGHSQPCCVSGGAGNTPPVSPPQGQPGALRASPSATDDAGGGGGGALEAGSTDRYAYGGDGAQTSISGSATFYAGGGGGGLRNNGGAEPDANADGGDGGGGAGGGSPGYPRPEAAASGSAGTANTGGGGGGGTKTTPGISPSAVAAYGGNGGKGIVIIRYKFQ